MIKPDVLPLEMRTYTPVIEVVDGVSKARVDAIDGTYSPSPHDYLMMDVAMEQAEIAGQDGDNPIGCVYVGPNGDFVGYQTREFRDNDIEGHAEKRGYRAIQPVAGRDLSGYTVYGNMEPCYGCAYMFDKGGLGRLFIAATKSDFPDFFRNEETLDHIWGTTRRQLQVIFGLRKSRAIEIFTTFPKQH